MAKSGMGEILTLGLIGAAVWFGWPYISQMLGSIGASPTTPTVPPPQPTPAPAPTPTDPCSGVASGTLGTLQGGAAQGVWNAISQDLATAQNVPVACQAELIALANQIATLRGTAQNLGVGGLGTRNYLRRGTPMRFR